MARGRGGGLPPRWVGPALHTNQVPAGGREGQSPTRTISALALAGLLPPAPPQLPQVVKVLASSGSPSSYSPHKSQHKMYYNV